MRRIIFGLFVVKVIVFIRVGEPSILLRKHQYSGDVILRDTIEACPSSRLIKIWAVYHLLSSMQKEGPSSKDSFQSL